MIKDLIKNKKLFKYIFKFQKPILLKEIFQMLIIAILLVVFIFHLLFLGFAIKAIFFDDCSSGGMEFSSRLKKAMSGANQVVAIQKSLGEPVSYSSIEEYANMMAKRFNLVDLKYLQTEKFPYSEYTKKEIRERVLEDYINKPILTLPDGTVFMFEKFGNNCKTVDIYDIENNDCLLVVDLNERQKPNQITGIEVNRSAKDRYYLIIDGNKDVVILPEIYRSYVF